jgi:hypothetical protein
MKILIQAGIVGCFLLTGPAQLQLSQNHST